MDASDVDTGAANVEKSREETDVSDVRDLAHCGELTDKGLLQELKLRYQQNDIYTFSGRILVAFNPFKPLPLYGSDELRLQQRASVYTNKPHVFSTSNKAISSLLATSSDQTILVSGNSGSGKTETCKYILKYIFDSSVVVARGDELKSKQKDLSNVLLRSGVVLEAFGNARTAENKNSTRCGRGTELGISRDSGVMTSARISHFCLDCARVTCNDRHNFHVFSYMVAGLSRDLLTRMGINKDEVTNHRFLGDRVAVDSDAVRNYARMRAAFQTLEISSQQLEKLFSVLGALIQLGDIKFKTENLTGEKRDKKLELKLFRLPSEVQKSLKNYCVDSIVSSGLLVASLGQQRSAVAVKGAKKMVKAWKEEDKRSSEADVLTCSEEAKIVADLLEVSFESLQRVLLSTARGEARSPQQASQTRDVTVRQLYKGVFAWLVLQINSKLASLSASLSEGSPVNTITVLDVCGFENPAVNGFIELCYNTISEALQQLFWQRLVTYEEEIYDDEGIQYNSISQDNNEQIVDLLMKPEGILSIIDGCVDPRVESWATESSSHVDKLMGSLSRLSDENHHCYVVQDDAVRFAVCHFTGDVTYDCGDWIAASCEEMPADVVELLMTSRCEVVKQIAETCSKTSDVWTKHTPEGESRASRLKSGLSSLVQKIRHSTPHFVCCIKPNDKHEAGVFDEEYVLPQIQHYGLVQAAAMTAYGYSFRLTFKEFIDRFRSIAFNQLDVEATKDNCVVILEKVGLQEWQIGNTQVLMKAWHEVDLEKAVCGEHNVTMEIETIPDVQAHLDAKKETEQKSSDSKEVAGDFLEIRLDGVDVECPPPLPVRSPHLQLSESNLSAVPAEEVGKLGSQGTQVSTTSLVPELPNTRFQSRALSASHIQGPNHMNRPPLPVKRRTAPTIPIIVHDTESPPPLPKRLTPIRLTVKPNMLPRLDVSKPSDIDVAEDVEDPEYIEVIDNGPVKSGGNEREGDKLTVESDESDRRHSLTSPSVDKQLFDWENASNEMPEYLTLIGVSSDKHTGNKQLSDESREGDGGNSQLYPRAKKMSLMIETTEEKWGQSKQRSGKPVVTSGWNPAAFAKAKETQEDLEQQLWYHGNISRSEAESRLLSYSQDQFLIRQSKTSQGYSLSASHHGAVFHYLINVAPNSGRFVIVGNTRTFPSLSVLIAYHHNHFVAKSIGLLVKPCPKQRSASFSHASAVSSPNLQEVTTPLPRMSQKALSQPSGVHSNGSKHSGSRPQLQLCLTGRESSRLTSRVQGPIIPAAHEAGPLQSLEGMSSLDRPDVPPRRMNSPVDTGNNQVSDPAVAAKIQELSCLINLEEKIVEAVESTVDLPNIDKKSRKKQQKTLARSQTKLLKLNAQLRELHQKHSGFT